jgi:hypothetical protein
MLSLTRYRTILEHWHRSTSTVTYILQSRRLYYYSSFASIYNICSHWRDWLWMLPLLARVPWINESLLLAHLLLSFTFCVVFCAWSLVSKYTFFNTCQLRNVNKICWIWSAIVTSFQFSVCLGPKYILYIPSRRQNIKYDLFLKMFKLPNKNDKFVISRVECRMCVLLFTVQLILIRKL